MSDPDPVRPAHLRFFQLKYSSFIALHIVCEIGFIVMIMKLNKGIHNSPNIFPHMHSYLKASSWTSWSNWSCNEPSNILSRERYCTKSFLERDECPPMMMEREEQPCQGHWGSWSDTSQCACGSPGIQSINRSCDNPSPMEYSQQCLMSNLSRGMFEVFECSQLGKNCNHEYQTVQEATYLIEHWSI